MRSLSLYILIIIVLAACAKNPSTEPVPKLDLLVMEQIGKTNLGSSGLRDTAVMVFRYQDGDGDLFRNSNNDGPNLIYTTYAFNSDSNKFFVDGFPNPATITQPAGLRRDQSIFGSITVPMRQFRSSDKVKIVKFEAFMVDMQNHKSNLVTSPTYTLSD